MSMTLRLTDEQDAVLTALAKSQGISKNEAAVRAILDATQSSQRQHIIVDATERAAKRYESLLDRLAQ